MSYNESDNNLSANTGYETLNKGYSIPKDLEDDSYQYPDDSRVGYNDDNGDIIPEPEDEDDQINVENDPIQRPTTESVISQSN